MPTGATPPGAGASSDATDANGTGVPGATPSPQAGGEEPSVSPTDTPPAEGGEPSADTDDDEPLRDDSDVTAARLERRFKRLTAARRQAERERDAAAQQHALELAQIRGQLDAQSRMLSGAAPALPETPPREQGPPQAEQFTSHEDYVLAAARYGAQQELEARDQQAARERQQEQQRQFQQQLVERETAFKAQHPDYDDRVRAGLAGKVSPILQQALMLVPDGPAVAYALATQPELVQRLNTLPPPLVLVELGRLSPPSIRDTAANSTTPVTNGTPPPPALPPPLTPLSGAGAGAPTGAYSGDDLTQEEYRELAQAHVGACRRGRSGKTRTLLSPQQDSRAGSLRPHADLHDHLYIVGENYA